ncbi:MAG: hypothetical protein OEW77_01605 [Gemmatimonadota bacterium]|nr:hypothetical protein [Gemmatimonadota bacterium]
MHSTLAPFVRSGIALLVAASASARVAVAQSLPVGVPPGAAAIEQRAAGTAPPARLAEQFDGLGAGFRGPQGDATLRNPSDNSLAVGRDHIVQTVNSRMAIFSKRGATFGTTGEALYGPVPTNNVFRGFGGPCEERNNGDAVVRYDQLADRWLLVMPVFSRMPPRTAPPGPRRAPLFVPPPARPTPPGGAGAAAAAPTGAATRPPPPPDSGGYAMCYAISTSSDPMGSWDRYEFARPLFPDYPRPAVWPDGYYVPTSTGDDVVEKHVCVVDRARMLAGEDATEQCVIVQDVNFLNTADLDGTLLPPAGAPNLVLAAGGTQLRGDFEDDVLLAWRFFVDWEAPARTRLEGPTRIRVAPYRYLCGGQLTNCVPQKGTDRRLDAQGDKLMARTVYRRFATHEALVAVHSVNTEALGGGVRWYELRLDARGLPALHQQGTFAPDSDFRWMASPAIDALGNIGIGYSFGGASHFPGQRFAGRSAGDPLGTLTFGERVLVEGAAAQTTTLRWEDYTQTAIDPADDCTVWYVGDYLKAGATSYSTRIGAFRMPGCPREGED